MTQPIEPVAWHAAFDRCKDEAIKSGAYESYASVRTAFLDLRAVIAFDLEAARQQGRRQGLEEAAQRIEPKNHPSDWTEFARINAESAAAIRALIEKGKPRDHAEAIAAWNRRHQPAADPSVPCDKESLLDALMNNKPLNVMQRSALHELVNQPAAAQLAGWKLVPVEPTPEMVKAWDNSGACDFKSGQLEDRPGPNWSKENAALDWKAMLDAAPPPPTQPKEPSNG